MLEASRATWTMHHVRAEAHRQSRPFPTARSGRVWWRQIVAAAMQAGAVAADRDAHAPWPEPVELCRAVGGVGVRRTRLRPLTPPSRFWTRRSGSSPPPRRGLHPDRSRTGRRGLASELGIAAVECGAGGDGAGVLQFGSVPAARFGAGGGREDDHDAGRRPRRGRPLVGRWWRWRRQRSPPMCSAGELGTDADTLAKFDHDQPAITPGHVDLGRRGRDGRHADAGPARPPRRAGRGGGAAAR